MYYSEEILAMFNSNCMIVVYTVHKKMPSQITLMVHPTISFRQQSYRSFRARCKKTSTGQSQENLPYPVSSVPLICWKPSSLKLFETKLMPQRLPANNSLQ